MMNETNQSTAEIVEIQNDSLDKQRVRALANSLDIQKTNSILNFGAQAQQELGKIADIMLQNVQINDSGEAGELLNNMVMTLRGFQGAEQGLNKKQGFLAKLIGKAEPLQAFINQFENVSDQIDGISNQLEVQKQKLLVDISALDHLYDATLLHFRELAHFIAAGETAMRHADEHTLPALKAKAESNDSMENAQAVRDYQSQRNELERRLHDLYLTRQVAMQALPNIRLIQENDKGLVNKINSTLTNTVPLWRQQLAQSVAIHRSGEAAIALKASSDLTNELLRSNAENLQTANRESRQQIERGVFDIEAVEHANNVLIATIEESISLNENARKARKDAQNRLQEAEENLKITLKKAATKPPEEG